MTSKEREHACFAKLQQLKQGSYDWEKTFHSILKVRGLVKMLDKIKAIKKKINEAKKHNQQRRVSLLYNKLTLLELACLVGEYCKMKEELK